MVRSFGMVMILKMRSRIIIVEQMILKPVQVIIKIKTNFHTDLSNMLRWLWFWKWNRGLSKWNRALWMGRWWSNSGRTSTPTSQTCHQRISPARAPLRTPSIFLLWLFYRSSDYLPSLSSGSRKPKMQMSPKRTEITNIIMSSSSIIPYT